MRKLLSLFILLLMASSGVFSQETDWAKELFLDGPTKDFGTVARGTLLTYKFRMKNTYLVPLQITLTSPTCNCVTATSSVSKLLPPDKDKPGIEDGCIDVTMDARRFSGNKTVSIRVYVFSAFDGGQQYSSQVTLQVKANSRNDVALNPGEMNFGVVAKGQATSTSLDVEYAGNLDWQVTGVETTAPLDPKVKPKFRGFDRRGINHVGYELAAALKPEAEPGTYRWTVYLKTNDPASPLLPVTVDATIEAPLAVAPSTVPFETIKLGQMRSMKILMNGTKPFQVLGVDGLGEGMSVELPSTVRTPQVITLTWTPSQTGAMQKTLNFRTSLDIPATVTVEGSATAE